MAFGPFHCYPILFPPTPMELLTGVQMKNVTPPTESERDKIAKEHINKIIAEETKKFVEENRTIILKRAEDRLKKMIEILK